MYALAKMFGRSPFAPLQAHMAKVAECVQKVNDLFLALQKGEYEKLEQIAKEISHLEHEADLAKNKIRNNLPKGLFLPVDREDLLEILAIQDSIADKAEDIAFLLTLRTLTIFEGSQKSFQDFLDKNMEAFHAARRVIQELTDLLQSSFGGTEAEKVKKMIEDVAFKEHEVDVIQHALLKQLYATADKLPCASFYLWNKIFLEVSNISNLSEKLCNRIRMMLDVS